ncbi:MAG: NADP-dependent oxidoreductase [Bryobacterales bacterium]|nr:NADP-dependent oxidoreductase [Bryobacterales bacterium]MBV9396926.1 NADP-dependent oxidoreductase [Bryobacterales bacterium]
MKAIRIHEYGGPEILRYEDAPRPQSAPGDVLVRVHAAAVNPVDWKIRAGYVRDWLKYKLPMIPGWDFSGVVEEAGPDAGAWKKGDEVYARPDLARDGAYAEYIAVRASEIAAKPKSIDHVQAAAIPLAALTAWQALFDAAGLSAAQKVLIHAAAGGVGHFAVQLAKWKRAFVAGTASARNHDFLKSLGADQLIDYTSVRFEDVAREFDVVLDTMAGETRDRSWSVLKKGGILVTILGQPSEEDAKAHGVRAAGVFVQPSQTELDQIAALVDSGTLKPYIQAVFPLAEAAKAHELSQTNHVLGKIVLKVI